MKIIVLQGDNLPQIHRRMAVFMETAKSREWEVIRIDLTQELSLGEILSSGSLFAKERLFIVDNPARLSGKDLDWLKAKSGKWDGNLVVFSEGFIPEKILKYIPNPKIEEFKLPRIIFEFLDSLYPGNVKRGLSLLDMLIQKEPAEFVFALLAKHYRDLYWAKNFPTTLPYQAWRNSKLIRQAKLYPLGLLAEIISELARIDIDSKTSKSDVKAELDLLILNKLE